MKKKILAAMACAMMFTAIPGFTAFAGQWKQDNIGSWYQNDNGSYVQNTWLEDEGRWYHFNSSGYMQKNEWIMDSGKWYYMGADGVCLVNTTTPDNYLVGSDGAYVFQMPATGLPTLESMKFTGMDEKRAFIAELYSTMYTSANDNLWDLSDYEEMIPENMNEIVLDAQYYSALCDHILKKFKNASLAESMASGNPATRVYGYCMEEYRQLYVKYLGTMSKNLKNGQFAAYMENLDNLEKESTQLENRYMPYLDEISDWYTSAYYYDYYNNYYSDYYSDYYGSYE